ncbi:MAG: UDP-N-acetylmuramate--L-alanine ligase [Chlamydiae bacterium]|nr:UDP-N-acetylmuramate--L-alanine ligase [Chlamydiota bacterium]
MNVYHLVGIGGIGMSALARILKQRGFIVRGSDQKNSLLIEQLEKEGIAVQIGHSPHLVEGADIVVYSSDIPKNHVEILHAKELNLPLLHRSELLHWCMQGKKPLFVTGTHGKTTTTSLLAHLLLNASFDPSFVIGGIVLALETNGVAGQGEFFVAEADESDGSFLKTKSFGAVVTNLENDHLSYWKTPAHLGEGFRQFFAQVEHPAHLFWCADDPRLNALNPPGNSYGFSESAIWRLQNLRFTENGLLWDLSHQTGAHLDLEVPLFGRHNALNASAAFALALSVGADPALLRAALRSFQGVHRRLEWKKEYKTIQLFDDYGHHPTEIAVTLSALRERVGSKRTIVVFQPHRYTRVQELLEEFCNSFELADQVILTDIYSAGEPPIEHLFSSLQSKMQQKLGSKLHYFPRDALEEKTAELLEPHDIVLTIGAGDITYAGERILEWL